MYINSRIGPLANFEINSKLFAMYSKKGVYFAIYCTHFYIQNNQLAHYIQYESPDYSVFRAPTSLINRLLRLCTPSSFNLIFTLVRNIH